MKPDREQLAAIRSFCEKQFEQDARASHAWDHTLRVHNLARHIAEAEGARLEIVEAAAYLHDMGRTSQDRAHGKVCHAEIGAELAARHLKTYDLPADITSNIVHCILTHRYRNQHIPETLEARVLFDADKLDSIGAVGIARAYLFAGEIGACLHNPAVAPEDSQSYTRDDTGYREFMVKLRHVKDHMLTSEGRRLALERHHFMEEFFARFIREFEGEL